MALASVLSWPTWVAAIEQQAAESATAAPSHPSSPTRVAVIGGGVGGGFAAYFLWQASQLAEWDVEIDVYDCGALGGRAQAVEYDGHTLEMGASMVYGGNRYISEHLDKLGLEAVEPSPGATFAVFDGNRVVFETSPWWLATLVKMVVRYQWPLLRFAWWPLRMFGHFKGIYALQDSGTAYNTPEEMLRAVGLYEWTQRSFSDVLQDKVGTSPAAQLLQEELIGCVNCVNYNQRNSQLNGLVGLVSTLPAVDTRTFAIKGGNGQLAQRLLGHARARVFENTTVDTVMRSALGPYTLRVAKHGDDASARGPYDAVIIAAPLSLSGLQIAGEFEPPLPHVPAVKYVTTVTSWVAGQLNPAYFNLSAPPQGAVFASDSAQLPFTSIAPKVSYPDFTKLYKLFSSEPLSDATLAALFHNHTRVAQRSWAAYPRYSPPEAFAPFRLAEGLYYNNAIESAASAMEMSAIAGRNSALLVAKFIEAQTKCRQAQAVDQGVDSSADAAAVSQPQHGDVAAAA